MLEKQQKVVLKKLQMMEKLCKVVEGEEVLIGEVAEGGVGLVLERLQNVDLKKFVKGDAVEDVQRKEAFGRD